MAAYFLTLTKIKDLVLSGRNRRIMRNKMAWATLKLIESLRRKIRSNFVHDSGMEYYLQ
jgi:hypothetical protein